MEQQTNPSTGPELRQVRNSVKLTVREVAAPLGVGATTLWEWETGKVPMPAKMAPRYRRALVSITRERAKRARELCQGKAAPV